LPNTDGFTRTVCAMVRQTPWDLFAVGVPMAPLADNDAGFVAPAPMAAELCGDNERFVGLMRDAISSAVDSMMWRVWACSKTESTMPSDASGSGPNASAKVSLQALVFKG
jgi:hypothetical protein